MFAFALAVGLSLFVAGLAAIGWACVTCIKAIFGCACVDDEDDDDNNDAFNNEIDDE